MTDLQPRSSRTHILTIALEDYFHGPAFTKVIDRKRWARFETRFEQNCLSVLDRLDRAHSQATFFTSAWIARSQSELCREVIRRGHELALSGPRGGSFRTVGQQEFRTRLQQDRDVLEEASGQHVSGYRVTDIFLKQEHLWALEILAEEGFAYDSSVSPFLRRFAAPRFRKIHQRATDAGPIWEVPLSSIRVAKLMIPMAGGNYFRQYPEFFIKSALRRWDAKSSEPLVLYFRLWDFDPAQPKIETGSMVRQFQHYRNGERMVRTCSDLLKTYRFHSIAAQLQLTPQSTREPLLFPQDLPAEELRARVPRIPMAPAIAAPSKTPISIVIPCFNEASSVPYLRNTLEELRAGIENEYDVQFIIVEDGSTDLTWTLLEKYFGADDKTKLVRHNQNRGVSAAILTGIQNGRDIVCSMDSDCSYDPFLIPPMLKLLTPDVDLVTASPYHPAGVVLNVPAWRLLLSKGASFLYRRVTGARLYTFTSCLRVYRRSAVLNLQLHHTGFLGVAEVVGRLAQQGSVIVEHPATLESRIFGRSKMKVLRTIAGHLGLLASLGYSRFHSPRVPAPNRTMPEGESTPTLSELKL